ncbi:MAG: hypothetical protein HQK89_14165 [Nitrospirae bacterium]|nr:hypothetical protein [Nitrospirota bacterium]
MQKTTKNIRTLNTPTIALLVLVLLLVVCMDVPWAVGTAYGEGIGRVILIRGIAILSREGLPPDGVQLGPGEPLYERDSITTTGRSALELALSEDFRIRLGEHSNVDIAQYYIIPEDGLYRIFINLPNGKTRFMPSDYTVDALMDNMEESVFVVQTPNAYVKAMSGDFTVSYYGPRGTAVWVNSGYVMVKSTQTSSGIDVAVQAGQKAFVAPSMDPSMSINMTREESSWYGKDTNPSLRGIYPHEGESSRVYREYEGTQYYVSPYIGPYVKVYTEVPYIYIPISPRYVIPSLPGPKQHREYRRHESIPSQQGQFNLKIPLPFPFAPEQHREHPGQQPVAPEHHEEHPGHRPPVAPEHHEQHQGQPPVTPEQHREHQGQQPIAPGQPHERQGQQPSVAPEQRHEHQGQQPVAPGQPHERQGQQPSVAPEQRHEHQGQQPSAAPGQTYERPGHQTPVAPAQPHERQGQQPSVAPEQRHEHQGQQPTPTPHG